MNGLPGPNPTETVTGGKTLELSKYDKVRKPHRTMEDTKIKVTTRTLSSELCCPICLDLLTCTMTTKECLHRFCSECITTALMRGNKECPTCRKKIVSKRSLRPDPNFDFLISKIWPDRKQYDAELNASMQLFQEQSNVQSLQKSIEEGIKAQAAYRKQRVQGSYDYEKRKRRPPRLAEAAIQQQQGDETTSSLPVELVTVPLAPVSINSAEMVADTQQIEQTMEVDTDSDDSELGSDSSSDDSSSLSSDSSLSSSSSALSSSTIATNTNVGPQMVSVCTTGTSPASVATETRSNADTEQTIQEMPRKSDDIEIELVPSKRIFQRVGHSVPNSLKTSHFICTSSDTTIAAIGEFLFMLANQGSAESPTSVADGEKSEAVAAEQQQPPNAILRPAQFFIVDQRYQLRKMAPNDCMGSALLNSIHWDRHLIIYFDLDTLADENFDIAAVIDEELLKTFGKATAGNEMSRSMHEASCSHSHTKADESIKSEQNTSNNNEEAAAQDAETKCEEKAKIPGGIEAEA